MAYFQYHFQFERVYSTREQVDSILMWIASTEESELYFKSTTSTKCPYPGSKGKSNSPCLSPFRSQNTIWGLTWPFDKIFFWNPV